MDGAIPQDNPGNSTYQTIQAAIDDNCHKILINNFENFYPEQLIIDHKVNSLYSFNGACILGSGHEIHKSNLDIRGLCFLYSESGQNTPLLVPKTDIGNLTIRNCLFDGQGASGAGVLQSTSKNIDVLEINSTTFQNWNYLTILAKKVKFVHMANNLFYQTTGITVQITYEDVFAFHENAFGEVRGLANENGVSMIRFIAKDIINSCEKSRVKDHDHIQCALYSNIQSINFSNPVNQESYSDVMFSLVGGLIPINNVFDNCAVLAQLGMQIRAVQTITFMSAPLLFRNNPLIRNSLHIQTDGNPSTTFDFSYDLFSGGSYYPYQQPFATFQCNWPCGFTEDQFPQCNVNPNWDLGYIPSENITYGLGVFHNASQALLFCNVSRISPVTGALEIPVYFTGEDGGCMFRDEFDVNTTGISFFGALLPNETGVVPWCFPRVQIYGDGWFILADNFTSANMSKTSNNGGSLVGIYHRKKVAVLPSFDPGPSSGI